MSRSIITCTFNTPILSLDKTEFWWFSATQFFTIVMFNLLLASSIIFLFLRRFHHSVAQPCALHALVDCCVQSARDEQDLRSIVLRHMSHLVLLLFSIQSFFILFLVFPTSASLCRPISSLNSWQVNENTENKVGQMIKDGDRHPSQPDIWNLTPILI